MAVFRQLAWILLLHSVVINAGLGLLCRINSLLIAIVINWVLEGLINVLYSSIQSWVFSGGSVLLTDV